MRISLGSCEALSEARTGCLATLIFVVFQRRRTQNVDKRSSKSFKICLQIKSSQTRLCFRSTPADPNAFPVCSKVLSLDDCRFKSVFYVLKRALARRSSIQMRFLYAQMCSRSTRVDPNAYPMCPDAFSLDACPPKCVFYMLRCALARRLSIQMRFRRRACTYKS